MDNKKIWLDFDLSYIFNYNMRNILTNIIVE